MNTSEEIFKDIAKKLVNKYEDVNCGKMMSAPGIVFKKKVFAFFYKEQMVFKLGKDFDIKQYGITRFTYLSPFKNKSPMYGWYEISIDYSDKWEELASAALDKIKKELN